MNHLIIKTDFNMTLQESRQAFFDRWESKQKENRKGYVASYEKLDDTEVICTEWLLKGEDYPTNVWSHSQGQTGGYVKDFKTIERSIATIGTRKQEAFLMLDLEVQIKDSWEQPLTKEYENIYLQNNKEALLINLI